MEKYTIIKNETIVSNRYNIHRKTIEFQINPIPPEVNIIERVREVITEIVELIMVNMKITDHVGFTFDSKDFPHGKGWLSFRKAETVTVDDVWGVLNGIFQSNQIGMITDTFCMVLTSVRLPVGSGNRNRNYNSFNEECNKRRGIITISNKDNLCLPRAIVVSMANIEKNPKYREIRRDIRKMQLEKATELMVKANVIIPNEGAGIPELKKFQTYLQNYKITVYRYNQRGKDVMYEGPEAQNHINLLYHDYHYNVITSLTAAFCCSYYCKLCHIPYFHKNEHRCTASCAKCQQPPPCAKQSQIKCNECNRTFNSENCYENHKKANSMGKESVCDAIRFCGKCSKTIKKNRVHKCGEIYCKICHKHLLQDHLCFMQRNAGKPNMKKHLFVFYDLETTQEKVVDEHTKQHEPNLCVFRQVCEVCINLKMNEDICGNCGKRQQILKQQSISKRQPIELFIEYILNTRQNFSKVVVVAHNGQAFDHQFILNHILKKTKLKPSIIMSGSKIKLMQLGNVKFIDSLNYFPMALAKLPKAFGFEDTIKKGYFPHLFNTESNKNYIGSLPDISFYSPNKMKEEERKEFVEWYDKHKTDEFKMPDELIRYCVMDVDILAQACLKFREQLVETGNVCPFTEACTVASACNKVFRRNFLKPNTIGIIPKNGYRFADNQSKIALQWMLWEEKQREINIIHAAKQREVIIEGCKVDGHCKETKEIFEFHGCYYHGHECIKMGRDKPIQNDKFDTLNLRYERTVSKIERLKSKGFTVIEKWECDFVEEIKLNKEIQLFVEKHSLLTVLPLNPRDAFYGGRTGNTKTYYLAKDGEKIKYIDVCSLYPYVCKTGKFPIGHPQCFIGKEECSQLKIEETNGIIKCKILPPQNLYHPVLPIKTNDKLMFALCRTCAEQSNNEHCSHNDEDRALTGTWVIDEVSKSLNLGYIILDIYEIWKYDIEQYDQKSKKGGLFAEMMNTFIKIKQQASGWPQDCDTSEKKQKYMDTFLNQEGIQLHSEEISNNPGLRCLAKLMLNSFWGKLGQRDNLPKTKIINAPKDFFDMMTNPDITINTLLPINDETLVVNYEYKTESLAVLPTGNVCLAAYTTAQARLKLYSYLEILQERVLYYDTDSVIYISREGEEDIPLGTCVGDMTDELEAEFGPGSYISEFVSGGPKNYAYLVESPTKNKTFQICKVKGICINHEVSKDVNFHSLKDMTLNHSSAIIVNQQNIRRDKQHNVLTVDQDKIFRTNSTKRKFQECDSVPYGYKRQRMTNLDDFGNNVV